MASGGAQMGTRFQPGGQDFLVVSTNGFLRSFVRGALERFGVKRIEEAAEPSQALETLKTRRIDLAIFDMEMAPLTGAELTRLVRWGECPPSEEMHIIVLSGAAGEDTVRVAVNSGVSAFLVKPFSSQALFRKVQNLFVSPREFVRVEGYRGPCRRTKPGVAPPMERRQAPACPLPLRERVG